VAEAMAGRHGRRILVVEDEDDLRFLLCDLLKQAGYDVDEAPDGQTCMDKIAAGAPDLVLLDLVMPRVSGWGVLQWLRGVDDAPPVIVLSGMGDRDTLARTVSEGATLAFAKPFTYSELLSACDALAVNEAPEMREVPSAR
jgi:DNA-binding response OmpR family regulator